ncbi:MAG: hypothetical protein QN178_14000 [Armatimonadota bacterium]|nr:hypothetical protein [Armatimonadota bacterium]
MNAEWRAAFARLIGETAAAFPAFTLDAGVLRAYERALAEVPLPVLTQVQARILAGAAGDDWFPSAPKWLALANEIVAEEARHAARHALPPGTDTGLGPEVHCRICEDTGWVLFDRQTGEPVGFGIERCGSHAGRAVRPCACREHNPGYRQRHPRDAPRFGAPPRSPATAQLSGTFTRAASAWGDDDAR